MTTGKTIALTKWTFVGKVMFLHFNILPRLVMNFLPRNKCLLISRLQSPSAVIMEPPKIKSDTVSSISPSICHEVMGVDVMILITTLIWSGIVIEVNKDNDICKEEFEWNFLSVPYQWLSKYNVLPFRQRVAFSAIFFFFFYNSPVESMLKTLGLTFITIYC